jgi:RNA polymerase sigma-70 factor (family 1)
MIDLNKIQLRIFDGEEKALGELYQLFHKRMCLFSKSLVRSSEIAEEVVEDVFVKLWRNRQNINSVENIKVYLYIAVKNTSLNKISSQAKELIVSPFDFLDIQTDNEIIDPFDIMVSSELLQRMQKVIEGLPPRCKIIFKLIREDGLKYKEVSRILNISVNTIDAQMSIAVKRICSILQIDHSKKRLLKFIEQKN